MLPGPGPSVCRACSETGGVKVLNESLYDRADLYHRAFSWDLESEIEFYLELFSSSPFPVERILEPACGSGRYFPGLAKRGMHVTGYDLNPAMVERAEKLIAEQQLRNCRVHLGDMAGFHLAEQFDGALNPVNSFRYLTEDRQILNHLQRTADMLRKGALYVLEFAYAFEDPASGFHAVWDIPDEDSTLHAEWILLKEDPQQKISLEECVIHHSGREFRDLHRVRLWLHEDFQNILAALPDLRLKAVYDSEGMQVLSPRYFGEMGNLYHILEKTV